MSTLRRLGIMIVNMGASLHLLLLTLPVIVSVQGEYSHHLLHAPPRIHLLLLMIEIDVGRHLREIGLVRSARGAVTGVLRRKIATGSRDPTGIGTILLPLLTEIVMTVTIVTLLHLLHHPSPLADPMDGRLAKNENAGRRSRRPDLLPLVRRRLTPGVLRSVPAWRTILLQGKTIWIAQHTQRVLRHSIGFVSGA